ncbi:hypothetical protein [Nonomuraea sp. NPDC003754]
MAAAFLMAAVPTATVGPAGRADAVVDPAGVIQRQLVPGQGVKIVERWGSRSPDGSWSFTDPVRGVVGFGKGTIVATDLKDPNVAVAGTRKICIGKREYESYVKPDPDEPLPPGKTWVTFEWPCQLFLKAGPHLSLTEAANLRAVLATTNRKRPAGIYDGVRTTLYEGTITFAQLHKANPDMRIGYHRRPPTGKYAGWKVSWRLWIGGDQLVRRAWSSWRELNDGPGRSAGDAPYEVHSKELRLSDWGMKVHIKPPPAEQTVESEEWHR